MLYKYMVCIQENVQVKRKIFSLVLKEHNVGAGLSSADKLFYSLGA